MSSLGSAADVSQAWLLLADVTHAPAGSWQVVWGWLVSDGLGWDNLALLHMVSHSPED